jgi:flagellar basal body-associated protein FliL
MKTFKLENETKIESGFKTPENYFDTFSARVLQQLPKEEPKTISLFERRKTWMYAAAAILVLALTIPVVYTHFYSHSSEIDETTLENYISYHSTVTDTDLVNLLDENDIQKISINLNIEDKAIENELSTDNNLEQYILN